MTGVKVMALPQVALPWTESVEDAVGDIGTGQGQKKRGWKNGR